MVQETTQIFTSRSGFYKYCYKIGDEGLHLISSTPISQHELDFPYDTIPSHPSSYTYRSKAGFWCMIAFTVFLLIVVVAWLFGKNVERAAFVIWGSLSAACSAWYFFSIKNYVIYEGPNGTRLPICFSKRQRQAARDFVLLIEEAKYKYIEKKIEQYLQALGRDRVNALIIEMRENTILDNKGYDRIMKKVEDLSSTNIVGFRKT